MANKKLLLIATGMLFSVALIGTAAATYASYEISHSVSRTVGKKGSVKTIFLDVSQNLSPNTWNVADNNGNTPNFWIRVWVSGSQAEHVWIKSTQTANSGNYRAFSYSTAAGYNKIAFFRVNALAADPDAQGSIYNQTDDLDFSSSNNLYIINSWNGGGGGHSGGYWSSYTPA